MPHDELRAMVYHRAQFALRLGMLVAASTVDASGRYRIAEAPIGRVQVTVIHTTGGRPPTAFASTETLTAPGQTVTADMIVDPSAFVEGTVVDETGEPLPDLQVRAHQPRFLHDSATPAFSGFTGAGGRFRIPVRGRGPFDCYVFSSDGASTSENVPIAVEQSVMPAQPVAIRVARRAMPSVYVRGRVVTPDGRVPEDAHVSLMLGDGAWFLSRPLDPATGDFAFGPLPPGRYTGAIGQRSRGPDAGWPLGPISLGPGQRHDFGVVRLPGVGRLRLRRAPTSPEGRCQVWIRVARDRSFWLEREEDLEVSLRAADYELRYLDGDCQQRTLGFHIDAGALTELTLSSRPARPCRLVFPVNDPAEPADALGQVHMVLTDDRNQRLDVWVGSGSAYDIALRPGVYHVEARNPSGLAGQCTFTVESIGPEVREISVPLR